MTPPTQPPPARRVQASAAAAPSVNVSRRTEESDEHLSLCEALDRLLHKGAVLKGEITISVANVDLVYLGFHMLLASVETARGMLAPASSERADAPAPHETHP